MTTEEQERIDEETKDLRRELNKVIRGTVPYEYGDFRFRVRKASNGQYTFITAEEDWHSKFGDEFKAIARKYGWKLKYVRSKGYYWLIEADGLIKDRKTLILNGEDTDD